MSERRKLTYETYLHLDKVLDSKYLESEAAGNRVDEEHLFIIVHQAFEIWFKQTLEDLGDVITTFQIPLVVQHFEILETMPPAVFLNFRKYLKGRSGFESLQFRLIENRFGLLQTAREPVQGKLYKDRLNSTQRMKADESEMEPSLFTVVEVFKRYRDHDIFSQKEKRLSFEAFHGALLISLYQDEPEFQMAYMTLKLIMDVDCLISKFSIYILH
uniref:Tryptophan 2,3-dioxygenase-like n=1 Tax=Crassostrea virginica TaxID=6565 RepID=A0A8B8D3A2_CRAVI|nr:tryptophan 2,3-dioxygenase-like [Crassostrea virginica]